MSIGGRISTFGRPKQELMIRLSIMHECGQHVQACSLLLGADEPIVLTGVLTTQILGGRFKQSMAGWYVLELLENS